jgi:hypothetical protein
LLAADTARARRLSELYFRLDSAADNVDYMRWRVATATGDSAALAAVRARLPRMGPPALLRITGIAQLLGIDLDDAERANRALRDRAGTQDERAVAARDEIHLLLNRGQPGQAAALLRQPPAGTLPYDDARFVRAQTLLDAVLWDVDSGSAAAAAKDLAPMLSQRVRSDPGEVFVHYGVACMLGQWGAVRGDGALAERALARMRELSRDHGPVWFVVPSPVCPSVLEALVAAARRRPDAGVAIDSLDARLKRGPTDAGAIGANLVAARLLAQRGDPRAALAAVRRRAYRREQVWFLSTYLREEGRLAALAGDTDGAIRAWRHYLALRADPEPQLKAGVDSVRAALARLERR